MTTPLNIFSSCSDENTRTISVINAAIMATFRATGKEQKECTLLDCGTGDGDFVSGLARNSNLQCHIFGIDLESDILKAAEDSYRAAGAISARAVKADIVNQSSSAICQALGWEHESNGNNVVHQRADILLASHIGYYIPPKEKSQTFTKFSRLITKTA